VDVAALRRRGRWKFHVEGPAVRVPLGAAHVDHPLEREARREGGRHGEHARGPVLAAEHDPDIDEPLSSRGSVSHVVAQPPGRFGDAFKAPGRADLISGANGSR
jgi:hypothetical protein